MFCSSTILLKLSINCIFVFPKFILMESLILLVKIILVVKDLNIADKR